MNKDRILNAVERVTGINPDLFNSKSKKQSVVMARQALCCILFSSYRKEPSQIEYFLKGGRVRTYHYAKIHPHDYWRYPEYKQMYDKLESELADMYPPVNVVKAVNVKREIEYQSNIQNLKRERVLKFLGI